MPPQLAHYIVEEYVEMRQRDVAAAQEHNEAALMTARQLLSILRLSQASHCSSIHHLANSQTWVVGWLVGW